MSWPTSVATDAELYLAVNNVSTVLDGGITAGDTTITVSDTSAFPSSGILTIDLAAIHYTSKNATQFLGCTRGFDGTTAAVHADTTSVFHDIPAAHHNVLKDELIAIETSLAATLGLSPSAYTASRALQSNGSGVIEASGVTNTELGYLSGVTSAIQTQLNGKEPTIGYTPADDSLVVHLAGAESITGDKTFSGTNDFNGSTTIAGTTTNDDASTGDIGETIESIASLNTNFPTSNQWGDLTSISLTAGDWLVCNTMYAAHNGATVTNWRIGISTTAGNSTAGLTLGDTDSFRANPSDGDHLSIPFVRMSLASTTTVYFKYRANYSVAIPQAGGRITAVRIR